jgi:transposase InsO family protein
VIELCRSSGKSIAAVARDLDLSETAVRRWVTQAEVEAGRRDGLSTAEREELVHRQTFPTRAAARGAIFEFIEVFHNRGRLHSTLNYRTPAEYEEERRNPSKAQAA